MHEASLVASLLTQVEKIAAEHSARRVEMVRLKIGRLSGVEVNLLRWAFDALKEKTVCEGAVLECETVDARWVCKDCGREILDGQDLQCPVCQTPSILLQGTELMLDRVELEVK